MANEKTWHWNHFEAYEFHCRHCGVQHMDEGFLDILEAMRVKYGKPIIISSGYRCSEYNVIVSKTNSPYGPHTTGKAADLLVSGKDAMQLICMMGEFGITGFGMNQKGPHHLRFLHFDILPQASNQPRPHPWSY